MKELTRDQGIISLKKSRYPKIALITAPESAHATPVSLLFDAQPCALAARLRHACFRPHPEPGVRKSEGHDSGGKGSRRRRKTQGPGQWRDAAERQGRHQLSCSEKRRTFSSGQRQAVRSCHTVRGGCGQGHVPA